MIITAATESNAPIEFAADVTRQRGRIVLVGVAGLNIPRPPFFLKELEFTVSGSLGPGRGDPSYEDKGIDYPIGFARWTAQRNMAAVLDTISAGKLPVERLTTHRFPIDRAAEAYDLITEGGSSLTGIIVDYGTPQSRVVRRVPLKHSPVRGNLGLSMIGAGNFARLVMMPALQKVSGIAWRGLATAKGMNAEHSGRGMGFEFATTDVDAIFGDKDTRAVFIATRHDLHAEMVIGALRAGKHVFVEKPLCIRPEELIAIDECVRQLGATCPIVMVGFNRRFAPAIASVRKFFGGVVPLSVNYRFAPGALPSNLWPHDEEVGGGRIVGEACHAIDTCVAIVGSPPVRVFAESVGQVGGLQTSDDRAVITIRHANGSVSTIAYEAGGDRAAPPERFEVYGGGRTCFVDGFDTIDMWRGEQKTSERGGKDKGHNAEFRAFIDAVRSGGPSPIPWEHVYGTTWASLFAVQSIREGMPFSIDE